MSDEELAYNLGHAFGTWQHYATVEVRNRNLDDACRLAMCGIRVTRTVLDEFRNGYDDATTEDRPIPYSLGDAS